MIEFCAPVSHIVSYVGKILISNCGTCSERTGRKFRERMQSFYDVSCRQLHLTNGHSFNNVQSNIFHFFSFYDNFNLIKNLLDLCGPCAGDRQLAAEGLRLSFRNFLFDVQNIHNCKYILDVKPHLLCRVATSLQHPL